MVRVSSLLLVWLAFLGLAFAATVPTRREMSNAERLKRGLAPNAPKRRFDSTKPRRATTSNIPANSPQLSNIVVGNQTPTPKRSNTLSYLMVTEAGALATTFELELASLFILPAISGTNTLQWVPQGTGEGDFESGTPYTMFASSSPAGALASLMFSTSPPTNAITDLFNAAAAASSFSPTYAGLAMMFLMDQVGNMFMAANLALAQATNPAITAVAAESVPVGGTPSISTALNSLQNQLSNQPPAPYPLMIWASDASGSISGYLQCPNAGGEGGCDVSVAGSTVGQAIIAADLQSPGSIFYKQNTNSAPQDVFVQGTGTPTLLAASTVSKGAMSVIVGINGVPAAYASGAAIPFSIPASGQGIVVADEFGNDAINTFQGDATDNVYICTGVGCQAIPTNNNVCLEAVSIGGSPSACAAYWAANPQTTTSATTSTSTATSTSSSASPSASLNPQTNPMQLYFTQISPVTSGQTPLTGWLSGGSTGFTTVSQQSEASTFYAPVLNTPDSALYWVDNTGALNVMQIMPGELNRPYPYTATTGTLPFSQPMFLTPDQLQSYQTTSFLDIPAVPGGTLSASSTYNGASTPMLFFSSSSIGDVISIMDTLADAKLWSPGVLQFCIETVTVGEAPTGACNAAYNLNVPLPNSGSSSTSTSTSTSSTASPSPTPNPLANPMQLYMTQISPVTSGQTPLTGWLAGQSTGFTTASGQSTASTFYAPYLNRPNSPLYWKDSTGLLNVAEILPGEFNRPAPYTAAVATIPYAQPEFVDPTSLQSYQTTSIFDIPSLPGGILTAQSTYSGGPLAMQFFYEENMLFLLDNIADAQLWHPNIVQVCIESVAVGQAPTGACNAAYNLNVALPTGAGTTTSTTSTSTSSTSSSTTTSPTTSPTSNAPLPANPMQFFVYQKPAPSTGNPLQGWLTSQNTGSGYNMIVASSQYQATTYYAPQMGTGSAGPLYIIGTNGEQLISESVVSQIPGSGGYYEASPNFLPLSAVPQNAATSLFAVGSNAGGSELSPVVPVGQNSVSYMQTFILNNALTLAYNLQVAQDISSEIIQVCIEAVAVGQNHTGICLPPPPAITASSPSVQSDIVNPFQMYVYQNSTANGTPLTGFLYFANNGNQLSVGDQAQAATFYAPNVGNTAGSVYSIDSSNNLLIGQVQPGYAYSPNSGSVPSATPIFNNIIDGIYTGGTSTFMTIPKIPGGIVGEAAPFSGGYLAGTGAVPFVAVYSSDNGFALFDTLAHAQSFDANNVELCIETVTVGQAPTGACQAAAAAAAAAAPPNPLAHQFQIHITQIEPVPTTGSPGLSGWMTTGQYPLPMYTADQSSATTYSVSHFNSTSQTLYWNGNGLQWLQTEPSMVPPAPYDTTANIPFCQPSFVWSGYPMASGWTTDIFAVPGVPGLMTANVDGVSYNLFYEASFSDQVLLMDTYQNAISWRSDSLQICMETVPVGQQPAGLCAAAYPNGR